MTVVDVETSQQCHKYFFQYNTFASKRPQVRTWGRQTCFLARVPSKLVTPAGMVELQRALAKECTPDDLGIYFQLGGQYLSYLSVVRCYLVTVSQK